MLRCQRILLKSPTVNLTERAIENQNPQTYQPGDHLVVDFGLYRHHGIACGDGSVIHFGRGIFDLENAIVEQVDMETFCQGQVIVVADSKASFQAEEIVARAISRIGEQGYDLFDNNCEHFANWCRSCESESQQANVSETMLRQTTAICAKPLLRRVVAQAAKRVAVGKIGFVAAGLARGPAVVAGVADAVQATVEVVAAKNGKTKEETQQIGRGAGAVSSAALGMAVGGPFAAAAGLGFWFFGQVVAEGAIEKGKQVITETMSSNPTGVTVADLPNSESAPESEPASESRISS